MSTKSSTVCDNCGKDLTTTGNCEDWMIVLGSRSIPSWVGAVTAMHIPPQFDGDYHFCSINCLKSYVYSIGK